MLPSKFSSLIVNKKIAVAVSGGPDSMALLLMLKNHPNIVVLTVDHGLRPESKDEAHNVSFFCASLNIPHHILAWKPEGPKTQDESRAARYGLLLDFCLQYNIEILFLGHHQNDLIETFIMRIWKKSGLMGLASISALSCNKGIILARPLLGFSKTQLMDFIKDVPCAQDPSNQNMKYLRTQARCVEDQEQYLKFIRLIGVLRSYVERQVLALLKERVSWETPKVMKVDFSFASMPYFMQEVFIEKIARIMVYDHFFKTATTKRILMKKTMAAYGLYWFWKGDLLYVSCEKQSTSCVQISDSGVFEFEGYVLKITKIGEEDLRLKTLNFKDCIHTKKTPRVNFLFSKTKSVLPCIFFHDLFVFLEDLEYNLECIKRKGWIVEIISTASKPLDFFPFEVS